jgi:hypothetical protein
MTPGHSRLREDTVAAGFLNLGTVDILVWIIHLEGEDRGVHFYGD